MRSDRHYETTAPTPKRRPRRALAHARGKPNISDRDLDAKRFTNIARSVWDTTVSSDSHTDADIRLDNGYTPSEWILVRRFIAEARHQIRSEGKAAPDRIERLFEHIADNLCSPFALEPTRMALGLPRDYAARFSRITGTGPKKYITHHRCMLARRILQHVDALVADVAMTIGIEDHSSFSRCYRRVIGHAPSDEKKIDPVQVLFPDPRLAENLGEILIGSRSLLNSNRFWESLCRRMTVEEIKLYILSHVTDIGLAHFHLLLEKSKYVGRTDSFRGEQLAHAAMASLKLLEYWSGEELFHEKVLGYIALANTSRRQFDVVGATIDLDMAETYLAHVSVEKSGLSCQVKFAKAQVFWWQGSSEKSLDLIHDTLPEIRRYGSPELLARTLIMAADIQESRGKPGPALSYLCEATGLTQFVDDLYVVFTAHYNLTHLYLRSGNGPKALASLETVLNLGKNIEDLVPTGHIFFLKGAVYRVSGKLTQSRESLLKARDEFGVLRMSFYVVLVDLELSLLFLGQGRSDQALGLVVETLPVISEFCAQYQGAAATLAIFQESERRKNIGESEIKQALSQLDRIRKTPRFQYSRGVEVSATQAGRFSP